jgi:hypothetical protein
MSEAVECYAREGTPLMDVTVYNGNWLLFGLLCLILLIAIAWAAA